MAKRIIQIMVFVFIFGICTRADAPASEMLRHDNYLIKYDMKSEKLALKVISLLDQYSRRMEAAYQVKIDFPVTIMIAESANQFQLLSGASLPEWTGAAYIGSRNTILLKDPKWANPEIDFEKDFLHELSHLFFQAKFDGENIPLWYNEGMAEYLSGRSMDLHSGLVLSNAIWAKTVISLNKIDSLLLFSKQKAELAYTQSLSAVIFLKQKLSENSGDGNEFVNWSRFHEQIRENGWASAFKNTIHVDNIDFEIAWYRHIEGKYRWLFILNLENLIWVALLLILALGMFWVRSRNRKLLKKWEYEEQVYGHHDPNLMEFDPGVDYPDYLNRKE